jgi:hypothetical protein
VRFAHTEASAKGSKKAARAAKYAAK